MTRLRLFDRTTSFFEQTILKINNMKHSPRSVAAKSYWSL